MSKVAPPLVPVQKTEPLILTENEAPGAAGTRLCAGGAASFRGCFHSLCAASQARSAVRITVGP